MYIFSVFFEVFNSFTLRCSRLGMRRKLARDVLWKASILTHTFEKAIALFNIDVQRFPFLYSHTVIFAAYFTI